LIKIAYLLTYVNNPQQEEPQDVHQIGRDLEGPSLTTSLSPRYYPRGRCRPYTAFRQAHCIFALPR